jgi:hypothetical protein
MGDVGKKDDAAKTRWHLFPFDALEEIAKVLTRGAAKYGDGNWEHVDAAKDRYTSALLRHVAAWRQGVRDDPEWGLHHLAHAGCCLLFLLALELRHKDV